MHWLKPVWGAIGVHCPELGGVHFSEVQNVLYLGGNQSGGMICLLSSGCLLSEDMLLDVLYTVIFPLYSPRSISST